MATTIQISKDLQQELSRRKLFDNETYEDLIWDLLEDTMELSTETKKNIEISREQVKKGKVHSFESVMDEANL
jgi:hypothetical protein